MYRDVPNAIRDFFDVVVSGFGEALYEFCLSSSRTIVILFLKDKFI